MMAYGEVASRVSTRVVLTLGDHQSETKSPVLVPGTWCRLAKPESAI